MGMTIVSGWTGRGYDRLGDQFFKTLDQFWPRDGGVNAAAYVDGLDDLWTLPAARGVLRKIASCGGLAEFKTRHKDNKDANGLGAPNARWKPVDLQKGYCWRFDAVKFSTQLFIPEAAAEHLPDGEIMVWFDIDVVFTAAIPKNFVEGLIGDADCVYLGRPPKHSELGFWAVRLSPKTRVFLEALSDVYREDEIFTLREWHSAFVFDAVRKACEETDGLISKNLTPGGHGHVWPGCPLGQYSKHLKGKRKSEFMLEAA